MKMLWVVMVLFCVAVVRGADAPDGVSQWLAQAPAGCTQTVDRLAIYVGKQQERLAAMDDAVARAVFTNVCARYSIALSTPPLQVRTVFGAALDNATTLKQVAQILRDREDFWRWRDRVLRKRATVQDIQRWSKK